MVSVRYTTQYNDKKVKSNAMDLFISQGKNKCLDQKMFLKKVETELVKNKIHQDKKKVISEQNR